MAGLLKILGLFVDLIIWVVRVNRQEKQREEVATIRSDPAKSFRNEFAGVLDNEAAGQPVHSSEACAQVNTRQ